MKEQQLKPVVCVMNPDDIYWMKEKKEMSKFSGSFLSPYEAKEMETTQGVEFPEIRENVIFMLDPTVKNRYIIRTEKSDADIVEKRINAIEVIVSLLGGKNFTAISERKAAKNSETQVEVKTNIGTPKVGVDNDTTVGMSSTKNGESYITDIAEFKGEYSEENYFKAVKYAELVGLSDEPTISSLLWERRPDHCNALHKKKYRVSTCKDLKENLEIANDLKVNVMKAVKVNIDVNVNTSHDERYLEVFEFKVEFGPVKKSRKWLFWILSGAIAALAAGLLIALL